MGDKKKTVLAAAIAGAGHLYCSGLCNRCLPYSWMPNTKSEKKY